ncbi:MAG: histidine phosphatase family protein [Myxococcota bacterium]|nr:histidine phosphatase family protein [Myxococcota bacterium]
MAIYLIRHGETAGNRDRIVQVPQTPLSTEGLEQAERLAHRLVDHPVRRILASDLARAHMTAGAISRKLGLEIESDALLQERNFGDLRGTPYDELEEDLFGPNFAPPGGETWEEFHHRVDSAWERVCALASGLEGHLAVVTHGLVLHSLAERHLSFPSEIGEGAGARSSAPKPIGNTALSIAEEGQGESGSSWRVVLDSCTAHLASGTSDGQRGITGI